MRTNYGPVLEEASYVSEGIKVDTGIMANTTYMIQTQQEIFNVYGRIAVTVLFGELVTDFSATATVVKFNATWTTPVISVANITANSGSLSGKVAGTRVVCLGTAIATGALVDAGPGISGSMLPIIIGLSGGIGTIGILSATANATSGTMKWSICYAPLSDGAYVTAAH
jgi:hypothetical protein